MEDRAVDCPDAQVKTDAQDKIILLGLVFGQAVLMQLLGIWVW